MSSLQNQVVVHAGLYDGPRLTRYQLLNELAALRAERDNLRAENQRLRGLLTTILESGTWFDSALEFYQNVGSRGGKSLEKMIREALGRNE